MLLGTTEAKFDTIAIPKTLTYSKQKFVYFPYVGSTLCQPILTIPGTFHDLVRAIHCAYLDRQQRWLA